MSVKRSKGHLNIVVSNLNEFYIKEMGKNEFCLCDLCQLS